MPVQCCALRQPGWNAHACPMASSCVHRAGTHLPLLLEGHQNRTQAHVFVRVELSFSH